MPQLNVLPLNVSQNIELKDESASFNSTTSNDDFSQYIDLHLAKNKGTDRSDKADSVKSEVSIAKSSKPQTDTKLDTTASDDSVDNSDVNDGTSSATLAQKIAASGKKGQVESHQIDQKALIESEQLMSFLTKADNTLISQSVESPSLISSSEPLSVEQKALYEAQLLLNSSNLVAELSGVAKALVKDELGVGSTSTSTSTESGQEISEEDLLPGTTAKVAGKGSAIGNLPVESSIEGKNKNDTLTENKSALSDVKTGRKTEEKLTSVSRDKTNATLQTSNQTLSLDTVVESDLVTKNNENASLTPEQNTAKQIKIAQAHAVGEKTSQNELLKGSIRGSEVAPLSDTQLPENEQINSNRVSNTNNKNQAQLDVIDPLKNTVKTVEKQVYSSAQIQHTDTQLTKTGLAQNSEVSAANEEVSQAAVQIKQVASASNQQLKTAEHLVNQSTPSHLSNDDAVQMRAQQESKVQLQASLTEQSQQKLAVQDEDADFVEKKGVANVKGEFSANGNFSDVSGKATQTAQHILEQQSIEILNPSVATEVTQSQKTNTQLHQETISLFRKDFSDAVKDKVMLMISQKLQQFDITLDPPELGNMQVRVNLQGEQAVVNFLVQSQQTKDALEQNMHKLRELLAEQGVDVGDANVEQQSQQSANEEGTTAEHNHKESDIGNMADANDVVAHTLSANMINSSTTAVDYYA